MAKHDPDMCDFIFPSSFRILGTCHPFSSFVRLVYFEIRCIGREDPQQSEEADDSAPLGDDIFTRPTISSHSLVKIGL